MSHLKDIIKISASIVFAPFAAFQRMNLYDKISVIIYLLLMLSITAFALWFGIIKESKPWPEVGTIIITGILVSVLFSIFDKIGLLLPVESRISGKLEEIKDHLDVNYKSTKEQLEKNSDLIESTSAELQGYSSYGKSRHRFGFNDIVGIKITDGDHGNIIVKNDHFIVYLLRRASAGSEICYMNSFITHDAYYYSEIEEAVRRGVKVRMLLMKPTKDCEALISRHVDYYKNANKFKIFDDYVNLVRGRYLQFSQLEEELAGTDLGDGFLLRYYTTSLNYPLITMRSKGFGAPEVAYTGFYGNSDAGEMPFIEWRDGDYGLVEKFHSTFEIKWEECKGNIFPSPDMDGYI